MSHPQPISGWYPDPRQAATLRWWNGTSWTDQIRADGWVAPTIAMQSYLPSAPMPPQAFARPDVLQRALNRWLALQTAHKAAILTGITITLLLLVIAVAASGFSQTEQKYLYAMHSPCSHPEVFDLSSMNGYPCTFSWPNDEKIQVHEGHRICTIEEGAGPIPNSYGQVFEYLHARHPRYSRVQINVQLIAAEKIICTG